MNIPKLSSLLALAVPMLFQSWAQTFTQEAKLVGTGAVGPFVLQGLAVALSADGNTALVGGPNDNNSAGAAWVYTRVNGVWTQQGNKLIGTGAVGTASQGGSVALSADGNTALIGGSSDNSAVGAAWVFTRTGDTWTQQGDKLLVSAAVGPGHLGSSVALSGDGNIALVSGDTYGIGAAWVFTRTQGVWTPQGTRLIGAGAVGSVTQGAASVALSANGNTALVGAVGDNAAYNAAWVFTRAGDVWTQQGEKLVGSGAVGPAGQSSSVALSADGNTALIGGYYDNGGVGAAWVFTRAGDVWTQQGEKLVGSGAVNPAWQGISVALSGDGNTALTGGPFDSNGNLGAAWVFTRAGDVWTQQGEKLVGTGIIGSALQGISVALSSDNSTALVGGTQDDDFNGATWVFTRAIAVSIRVKLGDSQPTINRKSEGNTPVAILSTPTFDAPARVGQSSLRFGHTGDEQSLAFCTGPEDVNHDGLLDLVCLFDIQRAAFESSDSRAVLKGKTLNGLAIEGTEAVRVLH